MSEYWVSKKKYHCKYCSVYITDDIPSRQHHEKGPRHTGNLERFVRGIYKTGEKQKKDREEEKREMKIVEQAAAAAFAQDIGAGIAKPSTSASSSAPTTVKPPPKPSNPYENYSTAASLGYSDPDADRLAEEMRIRRTQGVAGEWQVVSSTGQQPAASSSIPEHADTTADMTGGAVVGMKREAEGPTAEEEIRAFKLRKKQLNAGLGEIYDPGFIPVKLKKKEELQDTLLTGLSPSFTTESESVPQTVGLPSSGPNWTTVQLVDQDSSNDGAVMTKVEEATLNTNPSSKWAKTKWSEPIPDIPVANRTSMFGLNSQEADVQTTEGGKGEIKSEEQEVKVDEEPISRDTVPNDDGGVKFKKRRAPANAGRGRREI